MVRQRIVVLQKNEEVNPDLNPETAKDTAIPLNVKAVTATKTEIAKKTDPEIVKKTGNAAEIGSVIKTLEKSVEIEVETGKKKVGTEVKIERTKAVKTGRVQETAVEIEIEIEEEEIVETENATAIEEIVEIEAEINTPRKVATEMKNDLLLPPNLLVNEDPEIEKSQKNPLMMLPGVLVQYLLIIYLPKLQLLKFGNSLKRLGKLETFD